MSLRLKQLTLSLSLLQLLKVTGTVTVTSGPPSLSQRLLQCSADFFQLVEFRDQKHEGALTHSCMIGRRCHMVRTAQLQVSGPHEEELLARLVAHHHSRGKAQELSLIHI